MNVEAGLTPEQKIAGYVLPCVSRGGGNSCPVGLIRFSSRKIPTTRKNLTSETDADESCKRLLSLI
jgi:hypothetical protein